MDKQELDGAAIASFDDAVDAAFETLDLAGAAERAADERHAAAADAADAPAADGTVSDETRVDAPAAEPAWSDADQAALDALPAEAQALIERRLSALDATRDHTAALGDGVLQLIDDDLRGRLNASGMDEIGGLKHLIRLERFATSNPAGYLRFVAQEVASAGVDVGAVLGLGAVPPAQGADAAPDDPSADPRVSDLQKEVGTLRERLQRQDAERELAAISATIDAFRTATDPDGNLLHPHHAAVEGEMARLLASDHALTLEQAYEKAIWLNPSIRQQLAEAEVVRRRGAEEARARQDAAEAARVARTNVRPGSKALKTQPTINSLDDAIAIAMRDVGA